MGLILQGLYTIAAKAIIFIPLWAVCEQEFMVCSIGNVIYIFGRAAYTWPKLHINQTQKTNILHPQNRIKSRKGLRHTSCIHSLYAMCSRLFPFIHPTYSDIQFDGGILILFQNFVFQNLQKYLPKHLSFVQSVEFVWDPSHGSSFSNPLSGHISSFGNPSSELMVVASGLGSTTHFLWRILLQPLSKMMQSPNDPHVDQPHSFSVLICHIWNNWSL